MRRERGGPKKKNCLWPLFSKWMKPAFTAADQYRLSLSIINWRTIASVIISELLWSIMHNYLSFYFSHSLFEAVYNLSEGSLFLPITTHVFLNFLSNTKGLTLGMKVNPLLNLGLQGPHIYSLHYCLFSHFCEIVKFHNFVKLCCWGMFVFAQSCRYLFYLPR